MSSEKPGQKEAKIAPVDTQSTATAGNPNDGAPDWLSAPAHTLDADVAIKTFKTDPRMGLDEAQVREYQGIFGPNKLKETPPISFWSILLRNTLNGGLGLDCLSGCSLLCCRSHWCLLWEGDFRGRLQGESKVAEKTEGSSPWQKPIRASPCRTEQAA